MCLQILCVCMYVCLCVFVCLCVCVCAYEYTRVCEMGGRVSVFTNPVCDQSHLSSLSSWIRLYTQPHFPIICPILSTKVEQNCIGRKYFKWCHICCKSDAIYFLYSYCTKHNALNFLHELNGPRFRGGVGDHDGMHLLQIRCDLNVQQLGFQEIWIPEL